MKRESTISRLTRIGMSVLMTLTATIIFVFDAGAQATKPAATANDKEAASKAQAGVNYDLPFVQVEQMPVFPGGDAALLKFIAENTKYPENAKKNNITGKVIVRFIVNKDCSVSEVSVLQGVNPEIDAEAIRVIKALPKFAEPAKEKGHIVAVYYMLPITFALK